MQTEVLNVTGMTRGSCRDKVAHALEAMPGVSDVQVSLDAGLATVQFDEQHASSEQLASAVKQAGYGVTMPGSAPAQPTKRGCCS